MPLALGHCSTLRRIDRHAANHGGLSALPSVNALPLPVTRSTDKLSRCTRSRHVDKRKTPATGIVQPNYATQSKARANTKRVLVALPDSTNGPLIAVAVLTGLRRGELLGLKWENVDLERGEISIVRSLQRVRWQGLVAVPPKTDTSRRLVPLPPQAVEALREQRRRQLLARLKAGPLWNEGGWVFTTALGNPIQPSDVSRRFPRLLEKAGLPRIRFHDLRHTTATLLLSERVHPKIVAALLGHSTVQLTLDTYSHVVPSLAREAAAVLGRLASTTASSERTAGS